MPLSILVWIPALCGLIGALISTVSSRGRQQPPASASRGSWSTPGALALLGSLIALALSIGYIADYKTGGAPLQHVTDVVWIATLGIHYKLAITGLNVFLVGMTTLLFAASTLAANLRSSESALDRPRLFYFHFMLA
jgi:NADH-quinone oxidoreductase subunit M